jgi:PIN domain nuclease of toxin-antitoxin system
MNRYVVDTHGLYWYLTASPRLSQAAKAAFDEGAKGKAIIYVPAIVLAELYYLNQKFGKPLDFPREYSRLRQSAQFIFVAFSADDVIEFDMDAAVPDMHDRIIVGVARRLGASCISRDSQIINSGIVSVIW